jgi:hypothetical protein
MAKQTRVKPGVKRHVDHGDQASNLTLRVSFGAAKRER